MNGELELDWKLRQEKFEEDGPTVSFRKRHTKIGGLPSVDQSCQGNI